MNIFRNTIGIIIGYAVFVISAVLLFQLSGIDPHADPTPGIVALTVGYGLIFSFVGGLVAQLISMSGTLTIHYILALVMAGFAAFSMFKTDGNHYTQLAAICLFAPASILGGIIYLKRIRKHLNTNT